MASCLLPVPVSPRDLAGYVAKRSDTPVTQLFRPYREYEAHLRQLFAQEPDNPALADPFVNTLPLFPDGVSDIKSRARDLSTEPQAEMDKYIMPLKDDKRRSAGSNATVGSIAEFQHNFSVFSESALSDLNWDNVVAAGSSVINCLLPVPSEFRTSKRALRTYYHELFCPASDVDLFLYGLTAEQAVEKIKEIEQSIRDSILTETTTVRTKHAITICSKYPTRHIQIVLRIYKSLSEILTGFDIDCSGAAYDGKQVYCTPRALQSYITQVNHVDLSRRSPSYENRLSKYSHRDFEVYWPELDRSRIDPTIFERSFQRTLGLARLLVLERLPTRHSRDDYLAKRRQERGRPPLNNFARAQHMLYGNIKDDHEDEIAEWVDEDEQLSNYHTFTIPYGPRFHAKKIEKLCYTKDLLLNAEWNQSKDREVYLHRHPAFFGRAEDVINDCCGFCPKPVTEQEIEIAEQESKIYVSGELTFIQDDPGRQQIGSFHPLTDDDWTEMAYVGNTARLCQAIVDCDAEHVKDWLAQEGSDPNTRDYTGRTPLHLAVISSTPEIVQLLVNHGGRLVARLADGRTALHLAAERGDIETIKILMNKSTANEAEEDERQARRRELEASAAPEKAVEVEEGAEEEESDGEVLSEGDSEDDEAESMATGSFVSVKRGNKEVDQDDIVPPEAEEDPNFYNIDVIAWDMPCSALHLAVVNGHEEVVKLLCQEYGADAVLPIKFCDNNSNPTAAILTLMLALTLPTEASKGMAMVLLSCGATSAQADMNGITAFQKYVRKGSAGLVDLLMDLDQTGTRSALNHLGFESKGGWWCGPLQEAVRQGDVRLTLKLLDAGALAQIDFDTWLRSAQQSKAFSPNPFIQATDTYHSSMVQPLLLAIKSLNPSTALSLLERGADPNTMTPSSHLLVQGKTYWGLRGESALDYVQQRLKELRGYDGEKPGVTKPQLPAGIDSFMESIPASFPEDSYYRWMVAMDISTVRTKYEADLRAYDRAKEALDSLKGVDEKRAVIEKHIAALEKVEVAILEKGGKTFAELHPDKQSTQVQQETYGGPVVGPYSWGPQYRGVKDLSIVREDGWGQLFQAAWSGDLEKIKSLTLAAWGPEKTNAPLQIALYVHNGGNPFAIAFLRGHYEVARGILEIAQAQYKPAGQSDVRYKMAEAEYESDLDSTSGPEVDLQRPQIYGTVVDDHYTIENIGQVSTHVHSLTKPTELLDWKIPVTAHHALQVPGLSITQDTLLKEVIHRNDMKGLDFLLRTRSYFASQKLDPLDEPTGFAPINIEEFMFAVKEGRLELLGKIIEKTGTGLPLEELVKNTGVEMVEKPRYYQGLTVYGKKRKDWARAGRSHVSRITGSLHSPLLHAALAGNIQSVEWFLSDSPFRHYMNFFKSKDARDDPRIKHLSQTSGGLEGVISEWLTTQSDLVIHAAIMASDDKKREELIRYLIRACPSSLNVKSREGFTPLYLAAYLGRLPIVKLLIENGADQQVKDDNWNNILHAALQRDPKADQLHEFFDLLDPAVLPRLFRDRNNLKIEGRTPLHQWFAKPSFNSKDGEVTQAIEVAKLVLDRSRGVGLDMLDGAGNTVLHTLISRGAPLPILRMLLDFQPALLYRENAVGRTPAELARDKFVADRVQDPSRPTTRTQWYSGTPAQHWFPDAELVARDPATFLPPAPQEQPAAASLGEDPRQQSGVARRSKATQIWDLCREYMGRMSAPGSSKRRLASLHEANDVARRLGENYQDRMLSNHAAAVQQMNFGGSGSGGGGANVKKVKVVPDFVAANYKGVAGTAWKDGAEEEGV